MTKVYGTEREGTRVRAEEEPRSIAGTAQVAQTINADIDGIGKRCPRHVVNRMAFRRFRIRRVDEDGIRIVIRKQRTFPDGAGEGDRGSIYGDRSSVNPRRRKRR